MNRILIVEDDKDISRELKELLENSGYEAEVLSNFKNACDSIIAAEPDLVLLDINIPYMNGEMLLQQLRSKSDVPVIMVTSRDSEADEVLSMSYGADDYITKPFRPLELIARVKAQLRRYKKYSPVQTKNYSVPILVYKKLTLNTQTYECELNGTPIPLTPTEFSILRILLEKQGTVVSLEDLFHMVWKDEYYSKNSSTITVHVRHLREKLQDIAEKPQYIKTVWGVGYKI